MSEPSPSQVKMRTLLNRVAVILSVAVLSLVVLMRAVKIPLPEGTDLSILAPVNAILNSLVACCLIAGVIAIKQKKRLVHQAFMGSALLFSLGFLLCYVAYHFTTPEVKFGDLNHDHLLSAPELAAVTGVRGLYLFILISHIVLAAVSFPFILFTFIAAWTEHFCQHRCLAKFVFPVWLYVAVTGPICYLMLKPYYG